MSKVVYNVPKLAAGGTFAPFLSGQIYFSMRYFYVAVVISYLYINFHTLEIVSHYRNPQLQVCENHYILCIIDYLNSALSTTKIVLFVSLAYQITNIENEMRV